MAYSAVQLLSVSGILQNDGLGVAESLTDRLDGIQDTETVPGKLRRVAIHSSVSSAVITAMRDTLPGLCLVAPSGVLASSFLAVTDVTNSVRNRADVLFQRGVTGFLNVLSTATTSAQTSREVLGALHSLNTGGFKGVAPDIKNHIDLATGGITSKFGPYAQGSQAYLKASGLLTDTTVVTTPADVKRSIVAVADGILNLGTLYNFLDLASIGTPAGLMTSLYKQGLLKTDLIATFLADGVDVTNLSKTSDSAITSCLAKITGDALQRIIVGTNIQLPTGISLNTGADLLKAEKLLSAAAVDAIPGASLTGLAAQLISLNITFSTVNDIISTLRNLEIPDFPALMAMNSPVPGVDVDFLTQALAIGTGEFGAATLEEIIGTPCGYIHNDALDSLALAYSSIGSLAQMIAVGEAADALYAVYAASGTVTTEETDLIAALTTLKAVTIYRSYFETMDQAVTDMINQITTEVVNCTKTGVDVYATMPGAINTVLTALTLPALGADPNNIGAGKMLVKLAKDNKYGQAIRASLLQGQNELVLKRIGARTIGIPDVSKLSKEIRTAGGQGLTLQQKENVTTDARERGLDIANALSNAALYGYDNKYYVSRGYPSA